MKDYQKLLSRLENEGRLDEADKWRIARHEFLVSTGISDADASEKAWAQLEAAFPPADQRQPHETIHQHRKRKTKINKGLPAPPVPKKEEKEPKEEEDDQSVEASIKSFLLSQNEVQLDIDAQWVYTHLGARNLSPPDAPSPGAWELLKAAKNDRRWFLKDMLPRLVKKKDDEEEKSVRKAEVKSIDERRRILQGVIRRSDEELLKELIERIKQKKTAKKKKKTKSAKS